MDQFDLVVRGGTVVTAADTARADVGIRGGKITAVGIDLPKGRNEVDASGLLVLPGGIDSHVHLAQPAFGGPAMADGFESAPARRLRAATPPSCPLRCRRAAPRCARRSRTITRRPTASPTATTAFT